jgi:hypothetical protein
MLVVAYEVKVLNKTKTTMKNHHLKFSRLLAAVLIFAATVTQAFPQQHVQAAGIGHRSLTLIAGALDGGSKSGGTVSHRFDLDLPADANSVGSIKFEYCTTAANAVVSDTCVAPTGLDASGASILNEAGITGMDMHASGTSFYLSKSPTFALSSLTTVSYTISGIVNPNYGSSVPDTNKTFFVRVTVYTGTSADGTVIHEGTVAASTAEPIKLDGIMPESLVFCTGATVSTTAGVPDCTTATSGSILFSQLFSPVLTATATSQMAASTNAGSGYIITVNGPTLTNGTNTITALTSADTSKHGNSQFGLNLKANTIDTTPIGAEIAPASNGTNYRGQATPLSGYETADTFKFNSGDTVADSANATAGGTDAQIYTVTYIANVPGSLPAGRYASTLTYICTPKF